MFTVIQQVVDEPRPIFFTVDQLPGPVWKRMVLSSCRRREWAAEDANFDHPRTLLLFDLDQAHSAQQ